MPGSNKADAERGQCQHKLTVSAASLCVALAFAAALCFAPALRAQIGRLGKVKDFKFPDFYEAQGTGRNQTNRLKSLLTGAEAQPQFSGLVFVKQMRLENYLLDGQTNLIATAPECTVDTGQRAVFSTGQLQLATANGQFFIEGNEGFHCRLTNFNLFISNRVRTVIRQELIQSAKP